MAVREVVGKGAGSPDHIVDAQTRVWKIRSEKGLHFTDALAQGESENENLQGLESNRITITGIRIISKQALHFRLSLFSKDTFGNADLSSDAFLGSVDIDLSTYSRAVVFDLIP